MDKIGKYEIVRELGTGATSTVYLAVDTFSKQQVAVKLFDLKRLHDPNRTRIYRKLLMTEASLAGKLSHPHIARILDAVMEGDVNYVVMEYVEGSTLERYAEVDNLLPISTIAEIIYKCCKVLEYAQYQGVIHRDIKPANILLQGKTDIYSLGVVMYKLLTGKLPFDASNNFSMIYHIINIELPPPQRFSPRNTGGAGCDRAARDGKRYRQVLPDLG